MYGAAEAREMYGVCAARGKIPARWGDRQHGRGRDEVRLARTKILPTTAGTMVVAGMTHVTGLEDSDMTPVRSLWRLPHTPVSCPVVRTAWAAVLRLPDDRSGLKRGIAVEGRAIPFWLHSSRAACSRQDNNSEYEHCTLANHVIFSPSR
jgi:hypothetical protein